MPKPYYPVTPVGPSGSDEDFIARMAGFHHMRGRWEYPEVEQRARDLANYLRFIRAGGTNERNMPSDELYLDPVIIRPGPPRYDEASDMEPYIWHKLEPGEQDENLGALQNPYLKRRMV